MIILEICVARSCFITKDTGFCSAFTFDNSNVVSSTLARTHEEWASLFVAQKFQWSMKFLEHNQTSWKNICEQIAQVRIVWDSKNRSVKFCNTENTTIFPVTIFFRVLTSSLPKWTSGHEFLSKRSYSLQPQFTEPKKWNDKRTLLSDFRWTRHYHKTSSLVKNVTFSPFRKINSPKWKSKGISVMHKHNGQAIGAHFPLSFKETQVKPMVFHALTLHITKFVSRFLSNKRNDNSALSFQTNKNKHA